MENAPLSVLLPEQLWLCVNFRDLDDSLKLVVCCSLEACSRFQSPGRCSRRNKRGSAQRFQRQIRRFFLLPVGLVSRLSVETKHILAGMSWKDWNDEKIGGNTISLSVPSFARQKLSLSLTVLRNSAR